MTANDNGKRLQRPLGEDESFLVKVIPYLLMLTPLLTLAAAWYR